MTVRNFEVLGERDLRTLTDDQKKEWRKLTIRRKRLESHMAALDRDMSFFMDSVLLDVPVENHGAANGVGFRDDGRVVQTYCECYRCQTALQNLPATQVVEAMIKMEKIPPEAVHEARRWAAEREHVEGRSRLN